MRRRSAGTMAYKNGLRELSSASSHSQPNVSLMSAGPSEDVPGSPSSPYIEEGDCHNSSKAMWLILQSQQTGITSTLV
jgi:hypothetical protein